MAYGQWSYYAPDRFPPEPSEPESEWFEIKSQGSTFFDHDTDQTRALDRARFFCAITGEDTEVVRCTRWVYDGPYDENTIAELTFDEDTNQVINQ